MAKTMSTIRRLPGLIEIGIRMYGSEYPAPASFTIGSNVVNVDGTITYGYIEPTVEQASRIVSYTIEVASNFDSGSWSQVLVLPVSGFVSKSVIKSASPESTMRGITKWLFNPSDYNIPALNDSKPFWLRYTPNLSDGTTLGLSAPHLVLPYNSIPNRSFSINGTVGLSIVEIALPGLCSTPSFSVDGNSSIYVSFEKDGAEYPVAGLADGMDWSTSFPSFNALYVRGSVAPTKFYMNCRLVNSPTI
jgi:hypothetical protein